MRPLARLWLLLAGRGPADPPLIRRAHQAVSADGTTLSGGYLCLPARGPGVYFGTLERPASPAAFTYVAVLDGIRPNAAVRDVEAAALPPIDDLRDVAGSEKNSSTS